MTHGRQIAAFVLLFAWCFATGHLWVAHAGERSFEISIKEHGHDWRAHHHDGDHHHGSDHHGDENEPAEEIHHHHAFGVVSRAAVSQDLTIAAPMVALLSNHVFHALLGAAADEPQPGITGSPPDERCAGYLYVLQTARQVRGPSLAP